MNIPGLSDHDAVVTDSCTRPYKIRQKPRKRYKYGRADWESLKKDASEISQKVEKLAKEGKDIENQWTFFKEELMAAVDRHIPSNFSSPRSRPPWMSNKLKKLMKRKKRLYRQAKKNNNWTNYRRIQKEVKRKCRQAEWKYLRTAIEEGLSQNNKKPFWSYVKSRKRDNVGVAPLKSKGNLCSDGKRKADILVDQFSSVFTRNSSQAPLPELHQHKEIKNLHINKEGVEKLLRDLNPGKAPGPDRIPNRVLKECAKELSTALTSIFQTSLDTGSLPSDWTKANVSPIFKKGDKHLAENYRPVSLTSVPCKLLEHIICRHLMTHLETEKILTTLNHGFRKGFSCETQLITTINDLCKNMERKKQTDVAILDFSKAFDTVPHDKLLYKLSKYGIKGNLYKWLQCFLTRRQMKVLVDGEESEEKPVDSGVPQGTVLGPILFLCHINDLPKAVKSQVRLFADDCLLYRPINSQQDHQTLQTDLQELEKWADTWGMRFNAKKCYILSIKNTSSHFYQLGGHFLQQVSCNPYLGVTLSEDLTWSKHVDNITSKANSTIGFLRRNLRCCPRECRKAAFISLVRSAVEYCAVVWDPHLLGDIGKLEKVQKRGARFITQNYRDRTPGCATKMLKDLKLPTLQERRHQQRLVFFYKIVKGHTPALPAKEVLTKPTGEKRRINPTKRYGDTTNAVWNLARKNSLSYEPIIAETTQYKNSFFPRTISDWNNLEEELVSKPSVDSFRTALLEGSVLPN